MSTHHTRRTGSDQDPPETVRDNIIELGKRRKRRREASTRPESHTPLRRRIKPGSVLGYFSCRGALQVVYGSESSLWLRAVAPDQLGPDRIGHTTPRSWATFEWLDEQGRFGPFALVSWRGADTLFRYRADDDEATWMRLHSPEQAIVTYKALALYWHFLHDRDLYPGDDLYPNPEPAYIDPVDPSR